MSKEEFKESGRELGQAFKTFGKTFVRSAEATTDKVVDWADDVTSKEKAEKEQEEPKSTVYSDGSWRETGKALGGAFAGMGRTILNSVGLGSEDKNAEKSASEKKSSNIPTPQVIEVNTNKSEES